jgi:hypothetical protein
LTKIEIDSIQKLAVEQFIHVMGYEKSFPWDLVYAHQDFGGLNLPHLYSEMSAMKLEALIAHIRANSALGQALIININTIQLISGSLLPILEHNCNLNYLDDNWIMHLRTFIFEINASIQIDNVWKPQLQRENDVCLMDEFRTKTNLNQRQLTLLNYWRIYFQVIMLSDICEPGDEQIVQTVFSKQSYDRDLKMQQSRLHWPHQQKPGQKGFKLWISCLKQCFEYNARNRKINRHLGKWLPSHHSNNKWNYYFEPSTQMIYQVSNNENKCFQTITSRSHTSTFNNTDILCKVGSIPDSTIPSNVIHCREISVCLHSSASCFHSSVIDDIMEIVPLNWKQYLKSLQDWKKQFMKHAHIRDKDIAYACLSTCKDILIFNDGGTTTTDQGTFGTALSDGESAFYTSHGKCYNNHYYISSYRSECQAVLSGLLALDNLRTFLSVPTNTTQHIKIYCDNKKLIRNLTQFTRYNMTVNDHNKPDYDIIIEIITLIKVLRQHYQAITFHYIKSITSKAASDTPISDLSVFLFMKI